MQENLNHNNSISAILTRLNEVEKSLISYQQGRVEDRQRIERLEIRIESWVQGSKKAREPEKIEKNLEAELKARFINLPKPIGLPTVRAVKRHVLTLGALPTDEELVTKAKVLLAYTTDPVEKKHCGDFWGCREEEVTAWAYFLQKRGWLEMSGSTLAYTVTLPEELL